MLVVFALSLISILAMAGLLVDGGMAWVNRRQAQAAADTAALAGALAASNGQNMTTAAQAIAAANGYPTAGLDCQGGAINGAAVNSPPTAGPFAGKAGYLEVITQKPMRTTFAGAVGQGCWMVSARAVVSLTSQAAPCSTCVLSEWPLHSTFIIDNGNDLRIDGDMVINQNWWYTGAGALGGSPPRCSASPCTPANCHDWQGRPSNSAILMCGQGLYVDHTGGPTFTNLSAHTIQVTGGWQVRGWQNVVHADQLSTTCPAHPQDLDYPLVGAAAETNVCIGVPKIADPYNDPINQQNYLPPPDLKSLSTCPLNPIPCGPTLATCTALPGTTVKIPPGDAGSPQKLTISSATGPWTICPGIYFGGFSAFGDNGGQPQIYMRKGVYEMLGGGFRVTGSASIYGSAGVMIYNTGGPEAFESNSVSDPTLVPSPCVVTGTWQCKPTTAILTGPALVNVGDSVTFSLSVSKGTSPLVKPVGGTFTFFDGQDPICVGTVSPGPSDLTHLGASCTLPAGYAEYGSRGITGVYSGDSVYAPIGDTHSTQVNVPNTSQNGNIWIETSPVPCASAGTCGIIIIHSGADAPYNGVVFFQDRQLGIGLHIWPGAGLATCLDTGPGGASPPSWMTDGVPPNVVKIPDPCGVLGGINGTIYGVHPYAGSGTDTTVDLSGGGVANIQVVASEIKMSQTTGPTRLTYIPKILANGKFKLVE